MSSMNKYIQLFRTGNCIMGIIGVMVASFMAAGTGLIDHWPNLMISAVLVFMFIAGGNALNDSIDHEIDKSSHPERPVPSGRMTAKHARDVGLFMLFGSVAVSLLTFDLACVLVVIIACILMVSYEMFLKQRGFIGNVTIAVMTGMLFILGAAVIGDPMANIIVALMAMLVSIGREISKDIEDKEGDVGRYTLPMRIGDRKAAIIASLFYLSGPLLSIQPILAHTYGPLYYAVFLADACFLYCAAIVFSDPHKAQKMAKVGMMVGLVAFILGVI
jgi:geranylgeranylglycerol-phosphate geranylgeranyltransferase